MGARGKLPGATTATVASTTPVAPSSESDQHESSNEGSAEEANANSNPDVSRSSWSSKSQNKLKCAKLTYCGE